MGYKIIGVNAVRIVNTDFAEASAELSMLVNQAIEEGWRPQGGVAVGNSAQVHHPYLFQAMVRD